MTAYELADDVIDMLESWSKAYPTSMFPDPTQEDIDYINAQNKNLSARFFAHVGRHFINKGFTPAINMLRQQADRIAELEGELSRHELRDLEHTTRIETLENQLDKCSHHEAMAHQGGYEVGFEAGRQQGMKQERALWELAHSTQEIERGESK